MLPQAGNDGPVDMTILVEGSDSDGTQSKVNGKIVW